MKLNLIQILSGFLSTSALNSNFEDIETAIENTVSRDGTGPNQMEANLDMNSNEILNADDIHTDKLRLNGTYITPNGILTITADNVTFTPAGTLEAVEVQAAIEELDTETQTALALKVSKTSDTGSAIPPSGTTAQRDGTPVAGYMRFNSEDNKFEGYYGSPISDWQEVGGGQMLGNAAVKAIFYNAQTISEDITIPGTQNALTAGPITIADTFTVTVSDGATWSIV